MRHQFAQRECGFCWKDENDCHAKSHVRMKKNTFSFAFWADWWSKRLRRKARELRPRLENVFEDDVHLMVQLFNQFQETGGLKSLQVHHSREDRWLQWQVSLMQRKCSASQGWWVSRRELGLHRLLYGWFQMWLWVCSCVRQRQIYREISKHRIQTEQRTVFLF